MIELSKRLLRQVGQTNARYKMIEGGDKILLGLSGGKDSLALAHVLKHIQNVTPEKFELNPNIHCGLKINFLYCLANIL